MFVYNMLDLERFRWEGLSSLDEGKHTIVFDFKYDGPGLAKGGTGVLSVDGKEVARKTIEHTIPLLLPDRRKLRHRARYSYAGGLHLRLFRLQFTGTIDKLTTTSGPHSCRPRTKRR